MRVVLDTNIVVSGHLWSGSPRDVLLAARQGRIQIFTSGPLLLELEATLARPKFAARFEQARLTPAQVCLDYAGVAVSVMPIPIPPAVPDDPDDDAVLACALAAQADAIVTGDQHLLTLKEYRGIPILLASDLLLRIA